MPPFLTCEGFMRQLLRLITSPLELIFRRRSAFTTHVLTLVGWTAITQGLYICALPVLSRLYSVETFGHLAVLQSVSSFIVVIASLRYEFAILLPEDDETGMNLLALA